MGATAKPLGATHLAELSAPNVAHSLRLLAESGLLKVTDSVPFWSCRPHQYVAHYKDVAHLIKNGDFSHFSGRLPWSLAIRCGTHSVVSHGGMLGTHDGHVWNTDTVEGIGCRERAFKDLVYADHGQSWRHGFWVWSPSSPVFDGIYDGEAAYEKATSYVGAEYGRLAILFVAASLMPIAREVQFLRSARNIETDWPTNRLPYCSALQSIAATAGGVDPVPSLAWQLTTPASTYQTLLCPIHVKLVP